MRVTQQVDTGAKLQQADYHRQEPELMTTDSADTGYYSDRTIHEHPRAKQIEQGDKGNAWPENGGYAEDDRQHAAKRQCPPVCL
jgi:hypothetical protein